MANAPAELSMIRCLEIARHYESQKLYESAMSYYRHAHGIAVSIANNCVLEMDVMARNVADELKAQVKKLTPTPATAAKGDNEHE